MIGLWSDPKQQPLKSKLLARVCGPKIVCFSNCALDQCSEITDVFCQSCIEIVSSVYLSSQDQNHDNFSQDSRCVIQSTGCAQCSLRACAHVFCQEWRARWEDPETIEAGMTPTLTWGLRTKFKPRKNLEVNDIYQNINTCPHQLPSQILEVVPINTLFREAVKKQFFRNNMNFMAKNNGHQNFT